MAVKVNFNVIISIDDRTVSEVFPVLIEGDNTPNDGDTIKIQYQTSTKELCELGVTKEIFRAKVMENVPFQGIEPEYVAHKIMEMINKIWFP